MTIDTKSDDLGHLTSDELVLVTVTAALYEEQPSDESEPIQTANIQFAIKFATLESLSHQDEEEIDQEPEPEEEEEESSDEEDSDEQIEEGDGDEQSDT